jgi:hypothetical protein
LAILEFELMASCLLGSLSTTCATLQLFLALFFPWVSCFILVWPQTSIILPVASPTAEIGVVHLHVQP